MAYLPHDESSKVVNLPLCITDINASTTVATVIGLIPNHLMDLTVSINLYVAVFLHLLPDCSLFHLLQWSGCRSYINFPVSHIVHLAYSSAPLSHLKVSKHPFFHFCPIYGTKNKNHTTTITSPRNNSNTTETHP